MTAVQLRIHATLCPPPSLTYDQLSHGRELKQRECGSTPPAHSLIQSRAKTGSGSTKQAFDSAYFLLLYKVSVNCVIISCKCALVPMVYSLLLMRGTGAKDPTFGKSLEDRMHGRAKFTNPETFSRRQLSPKYKSSDSRGGSSHGRRGFDLSTRAAALLRNGENQLL